VGKRRLPVWRTAFTFIDSLLEKPISGTRSARYYGQPLGNSQTNAKTSVDVLRFRTVIRTRKCAETWRYEPRSLVGRVSEIDWLTKTGAHDLAPCQLCLAGE
jgi:hypothetical protein